MLADIIVVVENSEEGLGFAYYFEKLMFEDNSIVEIRKDERYIKVFSKTYNRNFLEFIDRASLSFQDVDFRMVYHIDGMWVVGIKQRLNGELLEKVVAKKDNRDEYANIVDTNF